jgi:hypothetical protein
MQSDQNKGWIRLNNNIQDNEMVIRDEKYAPTNEERIYEDDEEDDENSNMMKTLPDKPSVREINLKKLNQSIENKRKHRPQSS